MALLSYKGYWKVITDDTTHSTTPVIHKINIAGSWPRDYLANIIEISEGESRRKIYHEQKGSSEEEYFKIFQRRLANGEINIPNYNELEKALSEDNQLKQLFAR
jgi:hypothetical protein